MRMSRRNAPSVNAGSMADIAFLLLIFFLVTTTISADKGILRKLPENCPPGEICSKTIPDRNILRILINNQNEIMIDEKLTSINEVKNIVKVFIDNNGKSTCNYCYGEGLETLSDSPLKAVISLKHGVHTKYNSFIAVQDEISQAYYELRKVYATKIFKKSINELNKNEVVELKKAYPFILSEAETYRKK